jgi:hypothetical protein
LDVNISLEYLSFREPPCIGHTFHGIVYPMTSQPRSSKAWQYWSNGEWLCYLLESQSFSQGWLRLLLYCMSAHPPSLLTPSSPLPWRKSSAS